MAHKLYAILDDNNIVIDNVIGDDVNLDTESKMAAHVGVDESKCKHFTEDGTFMNRGNGGIGFTWLPSDDYFKPDQPYASWTYNESTRLWEAPIAEPESQNETHNYWWDEENQRWLGYPCTGAPDYNPVADPRVDYVWNSDTNTWEDM